VKSIQLKEGFLPKKGPIQGVKKTPTASDL
ncbi:MAG: hypothetical protein ACJAVF_000125, partial [Paraglaciecola sp.]